MRLVFRALSESPEKKQEKILIIGMYTSVHLQRWIQGIADTGKVESIWIFPSDRFIAVPEFFHQFRKRRKLIAWLERFPRKIFYFLSVFLDYKFKTKWRAVLLQILIWYLRPSVLHFHEMQHGAYIYNELAKKRINRLVKKRIISTWGSDLTLFSRVGTTLNKESRDAYWNLDQIRKCCSWADLITAEKESESDDLSRLGYEGSFRAPVYISVGAKDETVQRVHLSPSRRKLIMVKGYQHVAGRALNSIEALRRLSDHLREFEVVIFSASDATKRQAEVLAFETSLSVTLLPRVSHSEMLRLFSQSRMYIGLSISDGLSTSMLDSMSQGCFPIQSSNSAAHLFIEDGLNGYIVDPWDISNLEEKFLNALYNNQLVDDAVEHHLRKIRENYSYNKGKEIIQELYHL